MKILLILPLKKMLIFAVMHTYADVILPLALPQNYTYRVPEMILPQVKPGIRVVVQLGRRKLYTALVYRIH
ncbi:MAG: hypothetical protein ACPF9D_12920, partial [Owenweeksia sp.]